MVQERFYDNLIKHYREFGRDLPWRKSRNPYDIWVSEVILQQTKVAQGTEYFMTFLRYFPDIETLAKASESEVLKVWQGLGYYSRALNMHKAAKTIVNELNREFPTTYEGIRQLSGVGDYTAAAISSIAYGLPHAAVDGNVKRVISRIYGIQEPIQQPATVKAITEISNRVIVNYDPGEFNQAMMELGATICLPRAPLCTNCPIASSCYAFEHSLQSTLPVVIAKKKPVVMHLDFLFLEYNHETWISQRGKSSIWKGLYEFISTTTENQTNELPEVFLGYLDNPEAAVVQSMHAYKHQLTHRTIFARFWHLSGKPANIVIDSPDMAKVKIDELEKYPIHRLMHRYLLDKKLITIETKLKP